MVDPRYPLHVESGNDGVDAQGEVGKLQRSELAIRLQSLLVVALAASDGVVLLAHAVERDIDPHLDPVSRCGDLLYPLGDDAGQ